MTRFDAAVAPEVVERRTAAVLAVPLHRFLGIEVVTLEPGRATLRLPGGEPASNNVGFLHAGVLYALLDVACYLAAAPLIPDDQNAVSHDLHVSVMRPTRAETDVEIDGRLLRFGRTLVFAEGEARAGGKLIARATVTKSLVAGSAG